MKKFGFILLIIALSLQANAQLKVPEVLDKPQDQSIVQKKVDYSLSTGTSFFSSPGYASGSSFYLAPEFKLKLSPKFVVDAGIMLMQNRFSFSNPTSLFGEKSVVVKSGPSYDGVAYATGNYALNSRLTLSGSIVKSFSPDGNNYQNMSMNNSFQMMSFGVNYKLSEHMSISGGVRVIQSSGYNPYSGYNYMAPGVGYNTMNPLSDPFR